jgi:phenylalanyl-tRNA synthetase beta chain
MVSEVRSQRLRSAEDARDLLVGCGLREAITLSFIDPREDDRLGLPAEHDLRPKVALQNPLSSETGVLRTSLLPGLLQVAGTNARRQMRDCRLFEVGRTFHPLAGQDLPREVLRAGAVLSGRREALAWRGSQDSTDFFDAKGIVETLLAGLGVRGASYERATGCPWLHPGRAASIKAGDRILGWVGEMHPDRLGAYELSSPVTAFEVELDALATVAVGIGPFGGLARYPAVERDLAVIVDRVVSCQAIEDAIRALKSPLVQSIKFFDAFEGGRIPEGKVSMAFRVTYRSGEKTLTEDEVSSLEKAILAHLSTTLGARLRDV